MPLAGSSHGPLRVIPHLPLHPNEVAGRDIFLDPTSASWRDITEIAGFKISAAPILHRAPTVAYVFEEGPSASALDPRIVQLIEANAGALRSRGILNPRSLIGKLTKERQPVDLPDGNRLEPPPLDVP